MEGNETTAATDIYALGLVAYEMLTGRPPFPVNAPLAGAFLRVKGPPPSPRAFAPKLDRASEAAILRCLEIDPRHRFPSAREAAAAFRENQQSTPAAIVSRIKAPFTRLCRVLAPQSLFASIALGSLVLLAMVAIYAGFRPEPGPTVLERVQITNDGFPKAYGVAAIDGSTLYFNEIREGHLILAEVSTSGGAVVPVPTPLGNPIAQDFNSSRSELLVIDGTGKNTANFDDGPLWALKTPAETLRRIGNVVANNAAWSPEGWTIAYAQAGRIFLCDPEGSDVRE